MSTTEKFVIAPEILGLVGKMYGKKAMGQLSNVLGQAPREASIIVPNTDVSACFGKHGSAFLQARNKSTRLVKCDPYLQDVLASAYEMISATSDANAARAASAQCVNALMNAPPLPNDEIEPAEWKSAGT
jgi:hypothetical protein